MYNKCTHITHLSPELPLALCKKNKQKSLQSCRDLNCNNSFTLFNCQQATTSENKHPSVTKISTKRRLEFFYWFVKKIIQVRSSNISMCGCPRSHTVYLAKSMSLHN